MDEQGEYCYSLLRFFEGNIFIFVSGVLTEGDADRGRRKGLCSFFRLL